MTTWLPGVLVAYFTVASAIAYNLGCHWWPTLRSKDPVSDRLAQTNPLTVTLFLATIAIAWPITIPLITALHNKRKDRS
ncbi:hypothetical protein DBP19_36055 [Streptomyces sp. CS090A]|uniref:hypothetical protein n=1 Tax=Streptomyces sp. CS090A TaxID=2162710 RepID=UPI000D51AF5D|nr:hypothetical protein [Streptomyces sp. CS090A]PVC80553.1 hypothetical protein DBP19_36055 [Streptomyces sp. CS090A]